MHISMLLTWVSSKNKDSSRCEVPIPSKIAAHSEGSVCAMLHLQVLKCVRMRSFGGWCSCLLVFFSCLSSTSSKVAHCGWLCFFNILVFLFIYVQIVRQLTTLLTVLNAWWINGAQWPRLFTRQHWLRQCYYWHHVALIVSPGCRILVVLLFCGACHDPVLLMLVVQLRLLLSRSKACEISLFHFWSFFTASFGLALSVWCCIFFLNIEDIVVL